MLTEYEFSTLLKKLKDLEIYEEKLRQLEKTNISLQSNIDKKISDFNRIQAFVDAKEEEISRILREKTLAFPWLVQAIADWSELQDNQLADSLAGKPYPALKASDQVKHNSKEKKIAIRKMKIYEYKLNQYESMFPWLPDYIDDGIDEMISAVESNVSQQEDADPVMHWMPISEYNKLSEVERNQKALDRYLKSRKSDWQIGRDYERYVGYLYEQEGYDVNYHGITKGYEDLGRDLVCIKAGQVKIVQCKCWSLKKKKEIREPHINQLFGTMVKYYLDTKRSQTDNQPLLLEDVNILPNIRGVLVTSTVVSEIGKEFAKALNIEIKEVFPHSIEYPLIKCNINTRTGARIYHLPLDQQYDTVRIEREKGEKYVKTVREAEELGFRRAWKWHGKSL